MPKKVVVFPAGFSGCAFWRMRTPIAAIKRQFPEADITIVDPDKFSIPYVRELANSCDAAMFQAPGDPLHLELIDMYKKFGKKVYIDYDDYSFDLSPYNPRYAMLGTQEVKVVQDGVEKYVWKDGYKGFDLKANNHRFDIFKKCTGLADVVTVTTPYLADKFKALNPNIQPIMNAIDFTKWRPLERPAKFKDEVRIGWFGGDSHYKDLELIKPMFKAIAEKHKNVKFVMLIPSPDWVNLLLNDIPKEQLEVHYWADLEIYTLILASMFWDIGLSPIEVNEFGKCKSNIKWQEFAALKVPTVMTDCLPYSTDTVNWDNGVCVPNEGFTEAVDKLVSDKELRERIGQKAYDYVFKNYNLDDKCKEWYKLYNS